MKIGFVPIFNYNTRRGECYEFERTSPMGLLSLIAVLQRGGIDAELIDINYLLESVKIAPENFLRSVLQTIDFITPQFDILGFSTCGDSIQQTLSVAKQYKSLHPQCHIVLGGPQATLTAEEILNTWTSIDVVVHGEAEQTIIPLIQHLSAEKPLGDVRGISFRDANGKYIFTGPPELADLDRLPIPAYHKLSWLKESEKLFLDVGRGCPFACTFCATAAFWRRKFRLKSISRIIQEVKYLKKEAGVSYFDFCHDIFTLNLKKVEIFCDVLLEEGIDIEWCCSTRTNFLPLEVLQKMKRAGLQLVYLGIETASNALQKEIKKNLNIEATRNTIKMIHQSGVRMILSFIVGLPAEDRQSLNATLHMAIESAALYSASCPIQILTAYPDSELFERHKGGLTFDPFFDNAVSMSDLVRTSPTLYSSCYSFPFGYLRRLEYRYLICLYNFIHQHFRKTFWSLISESGVTFLDVFDSWYEQYTTAERFASPGDDGIERWFAEYVQRLGSGYLLEVLNFENMLRVVKTNAATVGPLQFHQTHAILQNYDENPTAMSNMLPTPEQYVFSEKICI